MRLSELAPSERFSVYRDGQFASLGKTAHSQLEMLSFLESDKYLKQALGNPHVSCVITTSEIAAKFPDRVGVLVAACPRDVFYEIHEHLARQTDFYWKHFSSEIDADASIHPNAFIAPANVRIGKGTVIEPGVTILERCVIGNNVIVRAGTTLGSEGFEFRQSGGTLKGVSHAGGLRVHDGVEIQSNCAVDRAIFGDFTTIGEDTKIDNLVHIGHRVTVGKRCRLVSGAVIAGNVSIGDDVWVGPRAVISNGLTVGDRAYITIGSVVATNVLAGQKVTGYFAVEHNRFLDAMRLGLSTRRARAK